MSVLHTVMAATLALSGTLPGLPSHRKRPANRRPDGSWIMGARERSRLAWRQRVDAAARAWLQARAHVWSLVYAPSWRKAWNGGDEAQRFSDAVFARDAAWDVKVAALAAPRPWRSPRKPDPRNHYPRRHRRACKECRCARGWLRMSERVAHLDPSDPYRTRFVKFTRNPHGRSDR